MRSSVLRTWLNFAFSVVLVVPACSFAATVILCASDRAACVISVTVLRPACSAAAVLSRANRFLQDKPSVERGLFDENLLPEELTPVRMGKIVRDRFPDLEDDDQEAVRQHAIAALN